MSDGATDADSGFAERVIAWQRAHGRRDLPWQRDRDPYRIWVSEVMLQQTQVATVIPYYRRFLQAFPDVGSLAAAPLERVLELWSGLGYYSRGRNLHAAAIVIVERHGGAFPRRPSEVEALPGIGRSTAAAICVFAFGACMAILDGNVKRVLARHRGIEGYPGDGDVARRLWRVADELMATAGGRGTAGDCRDPAATSAAASATADPIAHYTQGMMDLGAAVCTRRPDCAKCPVRNDCVARACNRIAEIPARRPKRALPHRETGVLLIESAGQFLLERRPPSGIWGGLWSLPEVALPAVLANDWIAGLCLQRFGCSVFGVEALRPLRHAFTHFALTLRPIRLRIETRPPLASDRPGQWWLSPVDAAGAALPTPIKRLLRSVV